MRGRILLLLAPALVGACVKAPPEVEPDARLEVPPAYAKPPAAEGAVDAAWWRSFGDAELDRLVELALRENRDLEAAAARVARAGAEARIAGAELTPELSARLNAGRQKQNFVGFPIPGGGSVLSTTSSRFGLSLDVTWEADLWGRIRAGARAAVADLQASRAEARGARLSIAGQTAKLWFQLNEARQQLRLAEESATSFRDTANQVRARYEAGIRPALDLRLALSNVASAEALVQRRRAQLDGATRQLEVLLGRYPSGTLLREFEASGMPALPAPVPAGLPAQLISRRPDLVAAERHLAAAQARELQARRALYPRLALTGGAGTVSNELGDLLDGDFGVWNLLGNLVQPIVAGGRLRAGVDLTRALGDEALALYAQAALRAFAEVESGLVAEGHLAGEVDRLADAAEQLTAARRLAEQRYDVGLGDYLVVLESQTRALAAQVEWLAVRRRLLENRVDLFLALGGGFEGEPDTPSPGADGARGS